MKRIFIVFGIFFYCATSFGQSEIQSSVVNLLEHSASAPNTASLGKYFEVPVNMSTGLPSIQIPLYTIKTGDITLPITLTYHGGGIKVNDPPSWVGIGWNLNYGGVINKQINGLDDYYATLQMPPNQTWLPETNYYSPTYTIDGDLGFHSMTALVDSMNSSYGNYHGIDLMKIFGRIIQNKYDGEADQYFFSNPEAGGMFFWDQVRQQYQTDNINGWTVAGGPAGGWSLTNKTGITYMYGAGEKSMTPYMNNYSEPNLYYSAWYLNSIYDSRNDRGINISHDVSAIRASYQGESAYTDLYAQGPSWYYFGGGTSSIYRYGTDITPNTIYFNEGSVQFVKDTAARLDIVGPNALKEIRVFDNNGTLKKKFVFTYYYRASRLFLQSVQEINFLTSQPSHSRPYSFIYDTLSLPPRYSYAQDKYGYYNGKTSNTTILPTESAVYGTTGWRFADRYIDTNYVKAGTLKQIVYPTGGTLNFQYEPNKDEQDSVVGGLRIKRVTNYDSLAGKKLVTEYRYVRSDGSPSGVLQYKPKFSYFYSYMSGNNDLVVYRIGAQPIFPLFSNQGSPVAYDEVEKWEIGDSVNLKSKYYFSNYLATSNDYPGPLTYQSEGMNGVPYNKYPNLGNFNGLNTKKEVFSYKNGQYKRIAVDSVIFSSVNHFKTYIWNVQAAWSFEGMAWVIWVDNPDPYMQVPMMNSSPSLNSYQLFHESLIPQETYSKAYDENGGYSEQGVIKTADSRNGNLKKVTTIASNGDTLTTYYTYIADFGETTSSNPVNLEIYNLQQANMIGLPVEVISTRKPTGGTEMVEEAHLYMYDSARLKKHLKISKEIPLSGMTRAYLNDTGFFYDPNYETENEVIAFDSLRNPAQVKFRDKTQSIIWDNDRIMAAALNTDVHDLAATSFETNAKGRWFYSKHAVTDYTAITGTRVYNLDSSSISCGGLQAGKPYTVSYWSKTGGKSVNSTSGTALRTANVWTYYEHQVTNPSGGVVTVSGGGKIDELRLRPTGILMTTYTYEPLLGMSSQCGPNNIISYYEYDGMGRLSIVRDNDKNIVRKICYGLAGQTENCSLFGNRMKTATFTRICGMDSVGSTITDSVAANIYYGATQAAADSLATVALNAHGQALANSTGTCTYVACDATSCPGPGKKCISGHCYEGGIKYLTSVRNRPSPGWTCTYVYCFSDGTVSSVQTNTNSPTACSPIGTCVYW